MIKPGMFISDRYEIIEKVGSGGMADVYKARCHRLNRFVAIKVLKAEYSNDKSFVLKFRAEAQSVAGLSHPNIVNVYDVGDDDGLYYIVMELVEGITLKNFIERKGKLEAKEAVGIAIQIAQGLEAAHDNGIIHRDIKPQNIIISREGKVKVADFGIARVATTDTINSNTMGSVHYISPEQARGGFSDERSDIYSLGITMYEMLSGMLPFAGDNTVSVALLHIQGEAMPLRELEPEISISLEKIVAKCMQKKPERRYSSAAELIVDLKRAITDPSGNFVKLTPVGVVDSSPTINITDDEINTIKSAARSDLPVSVEEEQDYNNDQYQEEPYQEDGYRENSYIDMDDEFMDDDEEYDDNRQGIDPKVNKIVLRLSIAIGVIIIVVLLAILNSVLGIFGSRNNAGTSTTSPEATTSANTTASVPDLIGKSKKDAAEKLNKLGFENIKYEEGSSDKYSEGFVMGQTPEYSLDKIDVSTEIVLTISTGPEETTPTTVTVPITATHTLEEVKKMLDDLGLNYTVAECYSNSVQAGLVCATKPVKGSVVNVGDTIVIQISKGPEPSQSDSQVEVPNLVNISESDARARLSALGLSVNNVSMQNSSTIAAGNVISQDISAGTYVAQGTSINLVVSQGEGGVDPTSYSGNSVTILYPLGFRDGDNVKVILSQDGQTKELLNREMRASEFPLTLSNIEGFSEGLAEIQVYVKDNRAATYYSRISKVG